MKFSTLFISVYIYIYDREFSSNLFRFVEKIEFQFFVTSNLESNLDIFDQLFH